MKPKFPEWMENWMNEQLEASEENIVAEASDLSVEAAEESAQDEAEVAHVDEAEQESRMKSVDEGYNVNTDNPDDKHFQDGEKVSEKAFDDANKRDMTTPEGRYAFDSAELEKLADSITDEIVSEITNSALNPAEDMLNREVPLAQLSNLVASVETDLHNEGIHRAQFVKTRKRLAETLQVTLPIEVTVGQPTVEDDSAADMAGDDLGDMGELPMFEEAPMEDAGEETLETEGEAMEDMMPMDAFAGKKENRFSKKAKTEEKSE